MKTLSINQEVLSEETLVSYKGYNFSVASEQGGQYGFERRVNIRVVQEDLTKTFLQRVGIIRLFEVDKIVRESRSVGCLIIGETIYSVCLERAKEFIKEYVDFIKE